MKVRTNLSDDDLAFPCHEQQPQICDCAGCHKEGLYRAPKSKGHLNEYFWFCLDHVRAYNARWDFFGNMTAKEIEDHIRFDTIWERPSWPFGHQVKSKKERRAPKQRMWSAQEKQAMADLGLTPPLSYDSLKARYRELVKRYHPDVNKESGDAAEKFQLIHQAYAVLQGSLNKANQNDPER